jgi:uncharacterized protein (UPF0548 family)
MSVKFMVQLPAYVFMDLPPALLQQVVNCQRFEYSYQTRCFHPVQEEANYDIRVATADRVSLQARSVAEAALKAAEQAKEAAAQEQEEDTDAEAE